MWKRVALAVAAAIALLAVELSTGIYAISVWRVDVEIPLDDSLLASSQQEISVSYSPVYGDYFETVGDLRIEGDVAKFSVTMEYCDSRGAIGRLIGGSPRPYPSMYRFRIETNAAPPIAVRASTGELVSRVGSDSRTSYELRMPRMRSEKPDAA